MEVKIESILLEQKSVLIQMMELYNYDFSVYSNDDVNEHGYYGYPYLDHYWTEDTRFPYFIRVDGRLAGFVLFRSCCEYHRMANPHSIAEFFVMKKYRRKGVGKAAAVTIFDMHKGGWEVTQWTNNTPAQLFWNSVIEDYTGGAYRTFGSLEEGHVGFTFDHSMI